MDAVADVQDYLAGAGIIDGATGWPSCRRTVHDESSRLVVLSEDGGMAPEMGADVGIGDAAHRDIGVHVMVRAEPFEGDAAAAKAEEIFRALHGQMGVAMGGTLYYRVAARTSGPIFAGFDERGRPTHTIAFLCMTAAEAPTTP